jgi:methionyl-tRNA formyltransferase
MLFALRSMLKMKIVFAGSDEIAVPVLESLVAKYKAALAGVITQPDRCAGRGLKLCATSVKELAVKYQLPVYQPADINSADFQALLKGLAPDLGIVVAYGQKISAAVLNIPRYGWVNLHPSLLPRYRGAAPVVATLKNGATETGVTLFQLVEKMDAGPIIRQKTVEIEPDETAVELSDRLIRLGTELLLEVIPLFSGGKVALIPQDETKASYAGRLKKEDGLIDWSRSAQEIHNLVRAFQPWPGAYTLYKRANNEIIKIGIIRTSLLDWPGQPDRLPGTFEECRPTGLVVRTGAGCLEIKRVKPAGKKMIEARDFINGYRLKTGDRFGC